MKAFSIKCCSECGSDSLSWNVGKVNKSGVQDGRLRMHDVSLQFYLGCNDCSETLGFVKEQDVLNVLNKINRAY